jgi:hypothetical protein
MQRGGEFDFRLGADMVVFHSNQSTSGQSGERDETMKILTRSLVALAGICLLASALRAEEKIPNMMADAKVGDWILLEVQGGIQMKQEVEAVTPEQLTLKIDTIMNGQVLSSMSQQIKRTQGEFTEPSVVAAPDAPKPTITKGTATVKGKDLECWIIDMDVQGKKSRTYMSKDVPITGIVKSEFDGQVSMKLVDFGRK